MRLNESKLSWQPLLETDLELIVVIADQIHPMLIERLEVFKEKFLLFPMGCRKFVFDNKIVGYGFSHPWLNEEIPLLDEFLGSLLVEPQCLYLHDVVVLPEARGYNAAEMYVEEMKKIAVNNGLTKLCLVSVYGTDVLWSCFGFKTFDSPEINNKLQSYGETAKYMVCDLSVSVVR